MTSGGGVEVTLGAGVGSGAETGKGSGSSLDFFGTDSPEVVKLKYGFSSGLLTTGSFFSNTPIMGLEVLPAIAALREAVKSYLFENALPD